VAKEGVVARSAWLRLARDLDPFRATWRLFTNVRWAIGIITFLVLTGLIGVFVPQAPSAVRGNGALEADWLARQEDRFGFLTDPMNGLGLFDVFHARWFVYALGLLVVSVAVCTASRLPSIWRTVTRPRKRVNDAYFQSARHRHEYATPSPGHDLEPALRKRLYKVERYEEGDTVYLFADRFQAAQLATFASHLALIVLLAAALVSRFQGFSTGLMIAEGSSAPVFEVSDPNQMQVELLDTVGRFSKSGQPLEYSSQLAIHRGGEEAARCTSTVNSPCSYNGYRFHQAAYFGFGADVQVRDPASGNVIYRETLSLRDRLPSPHVVVRDGHGRALLDERLVLTDILSSDELTYYGTLVKLDNGRVLTIGARRLAGEQEWRLAVFEPGPDESGRLLLSEGESASTAGLTVEFAELGSLPAAFVRDFPLPADVEGEGSGDVVLEMGNVVYGTDTASEGTAVESPGQGPPELTIIGLRPQAVTLGEGESVEISGYEYAFNGQREFAGLQVKKDRGDILVWIGAGLLIGGLLITFWVPRRRLWAKITPERTYLAGQAGHLVDLSKEMVGLARQAGATPEEEEVRDGEHV
jgi:cytochrome c biogenesis protein ResB